MTFQEAVTRKCEEYAKDPTARFIGYNTVYGSRMYGTLQSVSMAQCIETPVAENLMVGMAVGMALEGFRPVVCFERHDFMLLAMDGIVNHIDKLSWISGGQFKLPIIIRAIVGSKKPMDPGPMHKQDYTMALMAMLKHTPVLVPASLDSLDYAWDKVGKSESGAVVIVEYKDDYKEEMPESIIGAKVAI